MSVRLAGFDPENKIWTRQNSSINNFRNEFEHLLVSSFDDVILLTDQDIIKARFLNFILKTINNILPSGITCEVNSGKRTKLINKKVKGSRTSQHLHWEAMDLHFFNYGTRIRNKKQLKVFFDIILETLGDLIQQGILYHTFIHLGFATSRTKVTKRRIIKRG